MISTLAWLAAWNILKVPIVKKAMYAHPSMKYISKWIQLYLLFLTAQTMFQSVKQKIRLAKIYAAIAAVIIILLILNSIVQTYKIFQLQNQIEVLQMR